MKTHPIDGTLYVNKDSNRLSASFLGLGELVVDDDEERGLALTVEETQASREPALRFWITDEHSVELNREQARRLQQLLRRFVDTGRMGGAAERGRAHDRE